MSTFTSIECSGVGVVVHDERVDLGIRLLTDADDDETWDAAFGGRQVHIHDCF